MDRFGDLDIFARVVTNGSMSAAARELGVSPAVISKKVRRLEERLVVRLLQRTTRQLALTEAGQGFMSGSSRFSPASKMRRGLWPGARCRRVDF